MGLNKNIQHGTCGVATFQPRHYALCEVGLLRNLRPIPIKSTVLLNKLFRSGRTIDGMALPISWDRTTNSPPLSLMVTLIASDASSSLISLRHVSVQLLGYMSFLFL